MRDFAFKSQVDNTKENSYHKSKRERGQSMSFKALSIKKKLVLVLVLFTLVPAFLLSTWIYRKVSKNWLEKEYSSQSNELGNILKTTELQLKEYENAIYRFYQNEDGIQRLKNVQTGGSPLDYVQITKQLQTIMSENDKVSSVYFFSETGETFLQDLTTPGSYRNLYEKTPSWEEDIRAENGGTRWLSTYLITSRGKAYTYLSCGVLVKDLDSSTWKPLGILVLNIDISFFEELFSLLGLREDNTAYLIADEEGNLIWSNREVFPAVLEKEFFERIQSAGETCGEQEYKDDTYVVTRFYSDFNDWNYISMKNKSEVLKTSNWVLLMIAVEWILLVLAAILGAAVIQHYMIYPIQKLAAAMSVPEDELVKMYLPTSQQDEIGQLYQSFNEMNVRLLQFIEKNAVMNKKEKEYQMQILNAQINPHFIYNTLDTLKWMAMAVPAPDICRLILSFSDILRYSISKKETVVSIREEISCIRNYLNIYEERYEVSFGSFQIDERIYPYRTFKMLLQPIVENCIVHGFKQTMEGARIEVVGELKGEDAVLCIRDNGVGISAERISYILSMDSDRVGLSNINQRLKLLYGEEYGLQIFSEKGKGTAIVLHFPKKSLFLEGI